MSKSSKILFATLPLFLAGTAAAQETSPPAPREAVVADRTPGQLYSMEVHRISAAEAAERLQLQESLAQIQNCRMIHIPIDYIDDQQLLTVITQPA